MNIREATVAFGKDLVPILSNILQELCIANDKRGSQLISKFHSASLPPISIHDYLKRICSYADCSDTCYILALIYIDRIQVNPDCMVTSLNIHRLLITSVMLAAKFFDDHYYNNAYYARIGGVTRDELNALELEFLFMVGFSLTVTDAEFKQYHDELAAHSEALQRRNRIEAVPVQVPAFHAQPVQYQPQHFQQQIVRPPPSSPQAIRTSPQRDAENAMVVDEECPDADMVIVDNAVNRSRTTDSIMSCSPNESSAIASAQSKYDWVMIK